MTAIFRPEMQSFLNPVDAHSEAILCSRRLDLGDLLIDRMRCSGQMYRAPNQKDFVVRVVA